MKTKYYFLAALATAVFASCTNDEYVGDVSPTTLTSQGTTGAIAFGSNAGQFTRATSNTGTVAEMLDGQMKVLGVKMTTTGPDYSTVFDNYVVWSDPSNVTTSNPDATTTTAAENGWEYVTASAHNYGTTGTTGSTDVQNIKYWDWATNEYHFVAGSPVKSFTYALNGDGEIATATVADINGHINPNTSGTPMSKDPVYIAAPVKKVKGSGGDTEYNTDVVFQFTRQQTYVRVGVYETIPGYKITSINFYEWDYASTAWKASPQNANNIVLNSKTDNYFRGTNASSASVTVTYNWLNTPATYTIADASTPVAQESWYGGRLDLSDSNPLATSSTEATKTYFYGDDDDIDGNGYFVVLPTPSETTAQPIIIKCDYTLKALDGSETIKVSGATAAIPAAFCKWNPNTTYTYLFKISDNTNGKTDPSQPNEGLYPITFDATVIAEVDGTQQGYITAVTTPSITTYQVGSVTDKGVEYVINKPIYFTAQNDETGNMSTLSALDNGVAAPRMVQVYKVSNGTTEADLILTRPTTTVTTTIGTAAWNINGQTVAANQWATFTPSVAGTYAIEYITATSPAVAYAYKVVTVVAAP